MSRVLLFRLLAAGFTCAWILLPTEASRADHIQHAAVEISGSVSRHPFDDVFSSREDGSFLAVVEDSAAGPRGTSSAGGRSFAGALQVYSNSITSRLSDSPIDASVSRATAAASWTDRFQLIPPLIGSNPDGAVVRLSFYLVGHMSTSVGSRIPGSLFDPQATSSFTFSATTGLPGADFFAFTSLRHDNDAFTVTEQGWTSPLPTWNFGRFGAIVDYDIPYELAIGLAGAPITFRMEASTTAFVTGGANSDFWHTGRLGAITLVTPEGSATPESLGYSVVFHSGIPSPNVVPEPSSLALVGVGLAGVIAIRLRRVAGAKSSCPGSPGLGRAT